MRKDVIYLGETVSEEKAKEILDNAQYNMTDYRDDEFNFGVAKDIGGNNPYTIWVYDTDTFIHCNYEKAVEVLQDLEGAIEKESNEEKEYARNAIPTLWKMFKNGTWREGEYISDFFSDYYKDVFGHRPRTTSQIESELKAYATELGLTLNESAEEFKNDANDKTFDILIDYGFQEVTEKYSDKKSADDRFDELMCVINRPGSGLSGLKITKLYESETITESFDDSKKYHVTEYRVTGYQYRWSIINDQTAENGKHYALLENNEWGDEQCYLVVELGTEKMKHYTSHKTGKSFDLPTFDTVLAETQDSLLTALADEDIISYDEAERHMDESCKIQKKIESLEEQLNEIRKLLK